MVFDIYDFVYDFHYIIIFAIFIQCYEILHVHF